MHNAIQGGTAYLLCQALTALLLNKEMTYPQSSVYCVKGCGYQYIMWGDMDMRVDDKFFSTDSSTCLEPTSCGEPEICGGHFPWYETREENKEDTEWIDG